MSERIKQKETAQVLEVSTRTLFNWKELGVGPQMRREGATVFYLRSEVEAFARQYRGMGRARRFRAMVEAKEAQQ